jgi:hypothetical protein
LRRSSAASPTDPPAIAGRRPPAADRGLSAPGAWRPNAGEPHHRSDGNERGDDVGELDRNVIGNGELGDREAEPCDQRGRPTFAQSSPSIHHEHQYERDDQREERSLATDHRAEVVDRQAGHLRERRDRDRDRPKRHRGGVGNQRDRRGANRVQSETNQHHATDRHRRAESRQSLQQRSETDRDHDHLHAVVIRDGAECALEDREVARGVRHVVDPQRVDDNPHDRPQAEGGAFERPLGGLTDRHRVDRDRDDDRDGQRRKRRPLRFQLDDTNEYEQHHQRQQCEDRREPQGVRDGIKNLLVHRKPSVWTSTTRAVRCVLPVR